MLEGSVALVQGHMPQLIGIDRIACTSVVGRMGGEVCTLCGKIMKNLASYVDGNH